MPPKNKINAVLQSRLPIVFALAYVACGAIWLVINDRFLSSLGAHPVLHTLIDLLFVAVTACVFYLLFKRRKMASMPIRRQVVSGEHDSLLKRFFDLPFIGMAVIDPTSTRWLQVNDRLCQIFGYTREEMLRMTWVGVTHPADLAKDLHDFQRCARGEIQSYALEKRFLHKSGDILIARIEVNSEYADDGTVESFLVALEDITLRKQAEEALRGS
ncbi:MAG TPA: PAS domain S-box protein, partial [Methylophilaceae bacterium]|nr:PAS domain S-box protein [Methylophilaceae bacterium]